MAHNRKFVPGRVALVKERLRNVSKTAFIQDKIESIIIDAHFLDNAPFKWVGLIYRYGLKNMVRPEYQRINKKWGDLPIAVELDTRVLQWADEHDLELFKDIHMIAGLEALIDVGKKYKLPTEMIEAERNKYGDIPNSIEESEAHPELYTVPLTQQHTEVKEH
jgi:hypothetical protein